jgi:hypothetical protein
MKRHPFDPWSAVLGLCAVAVAIVVIAAELPDVSAGHTWWLAAVALAAGLVIIPWRRPHTQPAGPEPTTDGDGDA